MKRQICLVLLTLILISCTLPRGTAAEGDYGITVRTDATTYQVNETVQIHVTLRDMHTEELLPNRVIGLLIIGDDERTYLAENVITDDQGAYFLTFYLDYVEIDLGTYTIYVAYDWARDSTTFSVEASSPNNPPHTPSQPTPSNGASQVSVTADFTWTGGDPDDDLVTYDIYMGTTSPPPCIVHNQSTPTFNPGTLSYETTYYWRIVSWDHHGSYTTGPLWSFTTTADSTGDGGQGDQPPPPDDDEEEDDEEEPQENQPPLAHASASQTTGVVGLPVLFDATASSDADGYISSWDWEFGDTSTGTGEVITHSYEQAGVYTVVLTVTDNENATATTQFSLTIGEKPYFLFDVLVELSATTLEQGKSLTALITLLNVGVSGQVNGTLNQTITANNTLIWSTTEAVSVNGSSAINKTIPTSELSPGEYTYAVTYTYGDDQTATAQALFTVTTRVQQVVELPWLAVIVAVIALVVGVIIWLFKTGHFYFE